MRKSIALLLALFLFASSSFFVSAAEEKERVSNEEVQSIASRTVTLWYCATTFGKTIDSVFENWQPENFNYDSRITTYNAETIIRFAWTSRMFFDDSFNYEQYEIHGGEYLEDLIYRVPKDIMIETIKKYITCPNLSVEQLPFYDKAANAFVFTSLGGFGGGVGDKYWTITKKSNGNWLAKYFQTGLDEDNTYPALEKFTIEMTSDYKVVSVLLDVDLQSVSWKTAPQKTSYKTGETLNLGGATLKAKHKSGASWEVPVTADMVTGYNPNEAGKQTIRVNYYNKSLDFQVTVQAPSTSTTKPTDRPTDKPTDKPISRPTSQPTTQPTQDTPITPQQGTTTTVPSIGESTSKELTTTLSGNTSNTSTQSPESTQPTDIVPADTDPKKDSGFPLLGIFLIAGIVVVAGGGAAAVAILIKKGKFPLLKK